MITTITRRLEWDAAHRVLRHESKCATLHGHRYVALVTCSAETLDDCDRVVDFGVVKELVGGWIDEHWDHTTLVNAADRGLFAFCWAEYLEGRKKPYSVPGEPTAETIALQLLYTAQVLLAHAGITVEKVVVYETPNCSAEVVRGG
jgi:6-pyruvoyltetrahydropterin/6-carboxytetrahydropterin synthase